jgi:hypothetical protein
MFRLMDSSNYKEENRLEDGYTRERKMIAQTLKYHGESDGSHGREDGKKWMLSREIEVAEGLCVL